MFMLLSVSQYKQRAVFSGLYFVVKICIIVMTAYIETVWNLDYMKNGEIINSWLVV